MISKRELFFRHMGLPSSRPLALDIEKADGIYLYDADGRDYIDLVSGVSVSMLGHRHPEVIRAIRDQTAKYLHVMVYGDLVQSPQVDFARALTENLPESLDSVYFVNSGSEAVEGALKLAKRFTGRSEMAAFKNAYHGGTHGALSITGNERLKDAFRPLLPDVRLLEFNNFDDLKRITEKTACVVVESIQAEAGIILPKDDFLRELQARCDETGALLILDDIQMGFGRTGKLFSFENFDFVPDMLLLAKSMGGGMPLGAFITSREMMRALTSEPELGHITTFGGHPVCCAAGLAALHVLLDSDLIPEAEDKGKMFQKRLESHPKVKEIRRKGLMLGVELANNVQPDDLVNVFANNGLLVDQFLFDAQTFRIAPPLIITEREIGEACRRIEDSLERL